MSVNLQAIYLDHRRALLDQARAIVRDPSVAEDLIQESYIRAHRAAEAGPIDNMAAFLHRTVRNLAVDHLRRRRTRERFEITPSDTFDPEQVASNAPSVEDALVQRERLACFQQVLDALPERARKVWILSRVEGLPYPRIAEILGISPGTVFNDIKMAMGRFTDAMARLDKR